VIGLATNYEIIVKVRFLAQTSVRGTPTFVAVETLMRERLAPPGYTPAEQKLSNAVTFSLAKEWIWEMRLVKMTL